MTMVGTDFPETALTAPFRHAAIAALVAACSAGDNAQPGRRQDGAAIDGLVPGKTVSAGPDLTRLSMLLYLLQTLGPVPLAYDFRFGHPGIRAERLEVDIASAEAGRGVRQRLALHGTRHVGLYTPGERAGQMIGAAGPYQVELLRSAAFIADRFGDRSARQLDLDSTLLMYHQLGLETRGDFPVDDLMACVAADRPHVDPAAIFREAEFMADNNFLPNFQPEFIDDINCLEFHP